MLLLCFLSMPAVVEFVVAVIEQLSSATASGWRWQMRSQEEPWRVSQPSGIAAVFPNRRKHLFVQLITQLRCQMRKNKWIKVTRKNVIFFFFFFSNYRTVLLLFWLNAGNLKILQIYHNFLDDSVKHN